MNRCLKALPAPQSPPKYPELTGIDYGDDYITLEYIDVDGTSGRFTMGVLPDLFRFTLKSYATNWLAVHRFDAPFLSFYFMDEAGKTWEGIISTFYL